MVYLTPGIGLPVVWTEPAPAVLLAVPEIEVRVAPRRLRGLHLERVVVVTPSVPGCRGEVRCLPGGPLLVPLGQLPEETAEPGVGGLGRGILLLVLGVMRVLDDDVAVERGAVVHLENCGKAVRVDEVNDADGGADEKAERSGDEHAPEAPPHLE